MRRRHAWLPLLALLVACGCTGPETHDQSTTLEGRSPGSRDPFGVGTKSKGSGPLGYRQRHALVVGIGRYTAMSPLAGPGFDATEVAAVLASRFGFEDVVLLIDAAPATAPAGVTVKVAAEGIDRRRLLAELEQLRTRVDGRDALCFYYAGHGLPGFLVPADGRAASRTDRGSWQGLVAFDAVARALRQCNAHHTLAILDSCFSGSALNPASGFRREIATLGRPRLRVAEKDNLSRVFNRRTFQVITAGAGDESVADLVKASGDYAGREDLEGHSPFTGVLLQGLRGLTGRPDGRLLASDLGYYLAHTLVNEFETFRAEQAPRYASLGGEGDFLFLPAFRVLNPKLVAPLYMAGPQYAPLRESACRALGAFVAEQKASDRGPLIRSAIPHLSRLLKDPKPAPRTAAMQVLGDFGALSADTDMVEFRAVVPLLRRIVDDRSATSDHVDAARALGRLPRYASPGAVASVARYVDGLATHWTEQVGERAIPADVQARLEERPGARPTDGAPEQMAFENSRRVLYEWLKTEGLARVDAYAQTHERGKAFLQRAERYLAEDRAFEARMAAANAIGFADFGGPVAAHPPLLWQTSDEWQRAREILLTTPDCRLLWRSPPAPHWFPLNCVAVSPDGKWLAAGERTWVIRIWSLATGKEVRSWRTKGGHVESLAFSPDGKRLASGNQFGSVTLWNPQTGAEEATYRARTGLLILSERQRAVDSSPVVAVAFAPDGHRLATGSKNGKINLWDTRTAGMRQLDGHDNAVTGLAFASDGRLVSSALDRVVRIQDVDGKQPPRLLTGHKDPIQTLAVHPSLPLIVSAGGGEAKAWDLESGQPKELALDEVGINRIAFHPDGRLAVSGASGVHLRHIDGSAKPVKVWSREPWSNVPPARNLAFTPDGKLLATATGPTPRVFDLERGEERTRFTGHLGELVHAAFSPDGGSIISLDRAGLLQVRDAATGERTAEHQTAGAHLAACPDGKHVVLDNESHLVLLRLGDMAKVWEVKVESRITALVVDRRGATIATADQKGRLVLRRLQDGGRLHDVEAGGKWVRDLSFDPGGHRLASAHSDGSVRLWDVRSGKALWTQRTGRAAGGVAFHPLGHVVATGHGHEHRIWLVATGEEVRAQRGLEAWVSRLQFTPDGRLIVVGCSDGAVHVVAPDKGTRVLSFSLSAGGLRCLDVAPDGKTLLAGTSRGTLEVWHLGLEGDSLRVKEAHRNRSQFADLSADGKTLITATARSPVRTLAIAIPLKNVWLRDARTGGIKAVFKGHVAEASGVQFHPDGQSVISTDRAGNITRWSVPGGDSVWTLQSQGALAELAVSPAGDVFATATRRAIKTFSLGDNRVLLRRTTDGGRVGTLWASGNRQVSELRFSKSGKLLAAGHADGHVSVWQVPDHRLLRTFRVDVGAVTDLSFHPDERTLACGGTHYAVHLWDVHSGQQAKVLGRQSSPAARVAFFPDGKHLASSGWDGTLRVWDVERGREIAVFHDAVQTGTRLLVHPDGNRVLTYGGGEIRAWDVGDGLPALASYLGRYRFRDLDVEADDRRPDHIYASERRPAAPIPSSSHLALLRKDMPRIARAAELCLRFVSAGNLDAALRMFEQLPKRPERELFARALGRRLQIDAATLLGHGLHDHAGKRLGQSQQLRMPVDNAVRAGYGVKHLLDGELAKARDALKTARGLSATRLLLLRLGTARRLRDAAEEKRILWSVQLRLRTKTDDPLEDVLDFYAGKIAEDELRQRIYRLKTLPDVARGQFHYYAGIQALAKEEKERARKHFKNCLGFLRTAILEADLAGAELNRLDGK